MIAIRQAGPDDWEQVRALRLRALLDTPEAFLSTRADASRLVERDRRERLGSDAAATFLALDGARAVGLAIGAPSGEADDAAGLFSMWTEPALRGQGVGRRLVHAVIDWARAAAYPRLLLWVNDVNVAGIALYERAGFRPDGLIDRMPPPREHVTGHRRERLL